MKKYLLSLLRLLPAGRSVHTYNQQAAVNSLMEFAGALLPCRTGRVWLPAVEIIVIIARVKRSSDMLVLQTGNGFGVICEIFLPFFQVAD